MGSSLVTRRRFIMVATAAAAAACTRTPPLIRPSTAPRPSIPSGLEPTAGDKLQVLTWDENVWKYVLDQFSKTYGVTYDLATIYNAQEGAQRVSEGFDVYITGLQDLPSLIADDEVQALNTSYLSHLGDVWPEARAALAPFAAYGVPYAVTPYGVAWFREVDDPSLGVDPYGAFWDPRFAHMTSFSGNARAAIAVALIRIGADPNTEDPNVLARAAEELKASNAAIDRPRAAIWLDPGTRAYTTGGPLYSHTGSARLTRTRFAFPSSDALVSVDALVVPRKAHDPVLGHLFVNFMLRPKIALANAEWVGTTPPVTGADPTGRLTSFALTQQQLPAAHPLLQLSAKGQAAWNAVWSDVRATLEARA